MFVELGIGAALAASPPASFPAGATTPLSGSRALVVAAEQLFDLADQASARFDDRTATAAYRALAEDPNPQVRAEALFRHARLLVSRGDSRSAAPLLRRLVDMMPNATAPRLELARVLAGIGDHAAALRELRAAQATGLPANIARMAGRYADSLHAARPTGASIEIAIAPDSNINRATRSDALGTVLGDFAITSESKGRSGIGLSLKGQAFARLELGSTVSLAARAAGAALVYRKTRFNDLAADLAVGPDIRLGRGHLGIEAGVGRRWLGQDQVLSSARLGASWTQPVGSRAQLRLAGAGALVDHHWNDLQDGRSFTGQASLERALAPDLGVAFNLSGERFSAKDPGYSTTTWRAGLQGWKDLGRITISGGIEFSRLAADERLLLFPTKRADRFTRLHIGAAFRQLTLGGFAPAVRFSTERNRSTIELYDYRRRRTEFALVRAF